ncbi:hypothetical protein N781_14315 [Pontibacillus halophilus JSM 076056 = DSM 19796]|uniref:DUF4386 domain-containing protein n=1 Tax=Pontibacillus halophilus JSM 076056 = DSM 19796 TaxID=1385510 RepID=A0A0A5GPG8_9BACI|nr:DUF4386 domain-containing protein [Pontibacillus halophilus]KGX93035.1 hypothetical protein N781_14315 [Pontibacillus halophilus JSM 076056 = DSM 19796]
MNQTSGDIELRRAACLVAGWSLLLMTVISGVSYGYIHSSLIVEDPLTTLANLQASSWLFELEIVGWVMIFVLDLIVTIALYVYLKPIHVDLAQITSAFRLLYTIILGVAISSLVEAHHLVIEDASLSTNSAMDTMALLSSFETTWTLGLIVFGIHLLLLGLLVLRAYQIPKLLSYLLIVGGCVYVVVHGLYTFSQSFDSLTTIVELMLMIPMFVGEIGFALWLLVRGRGVQFHS